MTTEPQNEVLPVKPVMGFDYDMGTSHAYVVDGGSLSHQLPGNWLLVQMVKKDGEGWIASTPNYISLNLDHITAISHKGDFAIKHYPKTESPF